ncbi:TonB-dependent receptor domain-containing protein [Paraglaciecola arctica]|uniref:TonB-dependent receptor domain-containing protein n=1 Tax=Paraglaciecola arctica TaxID=1128911 RepID=UPI001C07C0BE|nr:TonB-dependent receptor [Paraglaciecola arctica]MBU3005298.1 TonB-dependent receptor [Paraglaciecola arctica]
MKYNFKLNAISAGVIASFMALPLMAQEVASQSNVSSPEATNDIEVIEVSGFKTSLQKAINAKRFSESVSDSIHAEDVGKSTDQNIADALSRVTGISVQESDGEGTRISIRGTNPAMNQISMNGVALTGGLSSDSGSQDNSVDLSTFSADMLSSIDVVKTAAADQDEGSLGGSVRLRSVKPLELNSNRRSFTVEQRFNEFSDEKDRRLVGSFSHKLLDDSFGFIITASHDNQKTRSDRINTDFTNGAWQFDDWGAGSRNATDLNGNQIRIAPFQRIGAGTTGDVFDQNGNPVTYLDDSGSLIADLANQVVYDRNGKAQHDIPAGLDPENMPEGQVLHYGDLWAGARDFVAFNLNTNERKRTSISTGFQWRPTDTLDIQLDITKTQQDLYTDNQGLRLNLSDTSSFVPESDEHVIDLSTNTVEKMTGRRFTGVFNRESGLREIDTDVVSLNVDYDVTDNFRMNLIAGYSKTTDETPEGGDDQYVVMNTAQWGTAGKDVVMGMPVEDYEKVGYDCTSGSLADCSYLTGSTVGVFDALDGSAIDVRSRFNPYDLHHNHLGAFTFRNNKSLDENKSLFLDFEYLVDSDHITSIEFGGKYAERLRDIQISNVRIENADGISSSDADDGSGNTEGARGFADINVIDILSGEAFPYDNFGEGIQSDRSTPFFEGWPMLSHEKALSLLTGDNAGDFQPRVDIGQTRKIEVDTKAVYLKVNFEALDGALTGNIGFRYVEDARQATGVGGINYMQQPWIVDPYELLVERNLTDENNPACPEPVWQNLSTTGSLDWRNSLANADEFQDCYAWQVATAYNFNNMPLTQLNGNPWSGAGGFDGTTSTLPADLSDPQANRIVWMNFDENGRPTTINTSLAIEDMQVIDASGNVVPTAANQWLRFGYTNAGVRPVSPFVSRHTSTWTTNVDGTDLYDIHGNKVWQRQGFVTNTAKVEALLPSININYAVNDEFIVRFASSKTMTRPNYDSLNPRTQINEGGPWDPANGTAGNTGLEFLESTNLDTSFEWYFSEDGMVSLALFNKNMVNFEETVSTPYHYKDRKKDYELQSADLLLEFDPDRLPDGSEDGCHAERYPAGWVSQWSIQCDVANINVVKNGKGSSVTGAEFSYTDSYDFLPGLGASINYTYQESERDAEEIGTTGNFQQGIAMPFTPKHSGNVTVFWEKDDYMVRLAHRYNGVQVVNSGIQGGVIWQDETNRLDLSSSYKITKNFSLTFNAINLTDDTRRQFYTYENTTNALDNNDQTVVLDEGDAQNESVVTSRTVAAFKSGRQFRIGIRGTF